MDAMDRSPLEDPDGSVAVADEAEATSREELSGTGDRGEPAAAQPDWWHRDHPTFTALAGFFSGLVMATVVPGVFVASVRAAFGTRAAEEAFPFVLLFLAIPIALIAFPRSRRFGKYLLLGIAVALLVVIGVGTVVFWLMVTYSS